MFLNGEERVSDYDGHIRKSGSKVTITKPCTRIRFYSRWSYYADSVGNFETIKYIQIEPGSKVTSYEKYKESIKAFYLDNPLLIGDSVEIKNGKAIHIRRYDKVVLNGEQEPWYMQESYSDGNTVVFICDLQEKLEYRKEGYTNFLFDKFSSFLNYPLQTNMDIEGASMNAEEQYSRHAYIRISKNRLTSINASAFKDWIKENPVTTIYELKKPIYKEMPSSSISLIKSVSNLSNNSSIPANMKVTVDRAMNKAVKAIELAKTTPTTENLSNARYWTNLLRESIKKDELQSSISGITSINDLTFDRKTVSANLDVYIKSENMLSISLDTNSVSFEGYSGAAPMELKDAVNITINSSLPYDLNAYMPTEISNNDGSSKIDFDVFNIKESGEANYQQFEDTVNEIVLKSDCAKGNNINHKIDLKLDSNAAHKADIYKTVIRFEAIQK